MQEKIENKKKDIEIELLKAQVTKTHAEINSLRHNKIMMGFKVLAGFIAVLGSVYFLYNSIYSELININKQRADINAQNNKLIDDKNVFFNKTQLIKIAELEEKEKELLDKQNYLKTLLAEREKFIDDLKKENNTKINTKYDDTYKNILTEKIESIEKRLKVAQSIPLEQTELKQPKNNIKTIPPKSIQREIKKDIRIYSKYKNARKHAKEVAGYYNEYPDYVLNKLFSAIKKDTETNSYINNLHIILTLAFIKPNWHGTQQKYDKIADIVKNTRDTTLQKWGNQALDGFILK